MWCGGEHPIHWSRWWGIHRWFGLLWFVVTWNQGRDSPPWGRKLIAWKEVVFVACMLNCSWKISSYTTILETLYLDFFKYLHINITRTVLKLLHQKEALHVILNTLIYTDHCSRRSYYKSKVDINRTIKPQL